MSTRLLRENTDLIEVLDDLHAQLSRVQLNMFQVIADADRLEAWQGSGARDMAHWLSMRLGISCWKARRWIAAAHALEDLPLISEAFARGELGIDKVVELTRFATPETEPRLIGWAKGVSCACIRRKADLACRPLIEDAQNAERAPNSVLVVLRGEHSVRLTGRAPRGSRGRGGKGPGAAGR